MNIVSRQKILAALVVHASRGLEGEALVEAITADVRTHADLVREVVEEAREKAAC